VSSGGPGADEIPEEIPLPERPVVPEPPKLDYQRPRPKQAPLRGPRGTLFDAAEARGMGAGWNIATALVSSLIAGTLLGMAVDKYWLRAETPWGLIIGFLLGCVSGFANVFSIASRIDGNGKSGGPKR
jgi:F0F1-type ATP synthase assembly protein I